jgi:UDP-N-acetylmuramoylalanine--D-glutamate ligase
MKVVIAGYGAEGKVNYKYWSDLGAEVAIADERTRLEDAPEGAKLILGEGSFEKLHEYDLVVRTASLNPARIFTHGKIWSATNEFFAKCPAPIIGVTGTKGKGTTSSLIAEILKAAGKKVHLVGNIGVPALDELPKIKAEDFVVFELSSFQLWDLEKSPETAVILMIEPDHMDVHASMEEYINAKANITIHQNPNDLLVYHPTNKFSQQAAEKSKANKKRYLTEEGAHISGNEIVIEGQTICKTNEVGLLGEHNLENVCAAITAAWRYTTDTSAIKSGVTTFKGLPHRLEFVREVDGIKFYDDSQATGVGSCLAALNSFSEPTVLIFGGSDKGVDLSDVINHFDPNKHQVVLIGQSSDKLQTLLENRGFKNFVNLGMKMTMKQIVEKAITLSGGHGVVLLSPAHASFDMFKSYQDRGDQFKKVVNDL